ncbi:MAG: CDP-alcohol phosphatidyltransferase family protein [Bacteroidia bacterium]|nr:CDP-alcohol phosphatidyltransferase family protein [Bacteroidia bacterium]
MDAFVHDFSKIQRWTRWHAAVMLVLAPVCVIFHSDIPFGLIGLGSFAIFVWTNRENWPPGQAWAGPANWITALRLVLVVMLAIIGGQIPAEAIVGIAVGTLGLDLLDGIVARRTGAVTVFGTYFDKETDAMYVLVLVTLLWSTQRTEGWVMLIGLIRYMYVLFLILVKPHWQPETRSQLGRYLAGGVMLALPVCFIVPRQVYIPLLLLILVVTCYSFGRSLTEILRRALDKGSNS